MTQILNLGRDIKLSGKSGTTYYGKIYEKESDSTLTGRAIVCLSDSSFSEGQWHHKMNAVYRTDEAEKAFEEFTNRNDISHLILIPLSAQDISNIDKVQDLIYSYIHT